MQPEVDESAEGCRETMTELHYTLEKLSTQDGIVSGVVDTVTRAMNRLTDISTSHHRSSLVLESGDSYVDYQTRMVNAAKEIARLSQEIVSEIGLSVKAKMFFCFTVDTILTLYRIF